MAIPKKDSLLVPWGSNFDVKVTASPVTYALTAAQALSFHTAYQSYVAAYNDVATARSAGTRSRVLTQIKETAKAGLLRVGRELYAIVQESNSVPPADKEDVGVLVRKTTTSPVPAPSAAPGISILATVGNTIKLRLFDSVDTARRGKPLGVDGAAVFSYVGATAPTEESAWTFEGNTARPRIDIVFPAETPAGSKVWFTAFWFNQRKQRGPAASPIGSNLPGGAAMAA
jgi:hypothetical protein